jgi:flagellar hook-length control protein FliK
MFRDTEVQGARGLEAVVASLLRVGGHDATGEQTSVRVSMQAGMQLQAGQSVAAVNASSTRVKLAEGVASTSGALDQAARERDDELLQARELLELPLSPAAVQPEPAPRRDAAVGQAMAAIVPVAPQLVDADVQPGQAGLGGATISINHPELGAMDLLVQSQNGRIEVRAVLETPHAAQVLRAQESALRYGIQQAGMTFGALRVRARTGDGETVKARDNTKRRRDHEWEA